LQESQLLTEDEVFAILRTLIDNNESLFLNQFIQAFNQEAENKPNEASAQELLEGFRSFLGENSDKETIFS
jgi:hypothetical protein